MQIVSQLPMLARRLRRFEGVKLWRPPAHGKSRLAPVFFRRFLIASALTICVSMSALAYAVLQTLQSSLVLAAADEGAALTNLFVGPLVQDLTSSNKLSTESTAKLDDLLKTKLGERTKVLRIWLRDGSLAYSNDRRIVAGDAPLREIDQTFRGETAGAFDRPEGAGAGSAAQWRRPLMEIYAPLYATGTTDVIAAGEIYNDATRLLSQLDWMRLTSVALVAVISIPMTLVLFLMAQRASTIIAAHRLNLRKRVVQAVSLASQNMRLRREAEEARIETVQSNERLLGEIGQDLHDGPIQRLSILSLKLDDGGSAGPVNLRSSPQSSAAELLASTLTELRNIATGLVLPQLEDLSTEDVVRLAIHQHEATTGSTVACEVGNLPPCSTSLRVCLYRFVQEGLNNAYHHAAGLGQRVRASSDTQCIRVVVSDGGTGKIEQRTHDRGGRGLGLPGLRRRLEAFHGTLEVALQPDGTHVSAEIPIEVASNRRTSDTAS